MIDTEDASTAVLL